MDMTLGQGEAKRKIPGFHSETVGLIDQATLQAWPKGPHSGGVTALGHTHSEGALGHGYFVIQHLHQMHPWKPVTASVRGRRALLLAPIPSMP